MKDETQFTDESGDSDTNATINIDCHLNDNWNCGICSFSNVAKDVNCSICFTLRPMTPVNDKKVEVTVKKPIVHGWECSACTYVNEEKILSCTTCGKARTTPQRRTSVSSESSISEAGHKINNVTERETLKSRSASHGKNHKQGREKSKSHHSDPVTKTTKKDQTMTKSESHLHSKQEEGWICDKCTFRNRPKDSMCESCLNIPETSTNSRHSKMQISDIKNGHSQETEAEIENSRKYDKPVSAALNPRIEPRNIKSENEDTAKNNMNPKTQKTERDTDIHRNSNRGYLTDQSNRQTHDQRHAMSERSKSPNFSHRNIAQRASLPPTKGQKYRPEEVSGRSQWKCGKCSHLNDPSRTNCRTCHKKRNRATANSSSMISKSLTAMPTGNGDGQRCRKCQQGQAVLSTSKRSTHKGPLCDTCERKKEKKPWNRFKRFFHIK